MRHPHRVQELRMFVQVHGHRPDRNFPDTVERPLAGWVLAATYRPDGNPEVTQLEASVLGTLHPNNVPAAA